MKKIMLKNSLLFLSLFLLGACQDPVPQLQESSSQPYIEPAPSIEKEEVKTVEYLSENFVENDDSNRVFLECFATGEIALQAKCKKEIDAFLAQAPLRSKREIFIQVHTDMGSSNTANLTISQKRAQKVAASLFHKEYIHSKVFFQGFGEEKPLYLERSLKADKENRRVVVNIREKENNFVKKGYTLYKKSSVTAQKKVKKKTEARVKKEPLQIKKFTGEADTGWIYFGAPSLKKKFDISCAQDKPRTAKSRAVDGHNASAFLSGINKKVLQAKMGKETLLLAPVTVFEDGAIDTNRPNLVVTQKNNKKTVLATKINTYNGKKGMLYRVFVDKKNSPKHSLECVDIVFDYVKGDVKYGVAYFRINGKSMSKKLTGF
ncbi:MAG: OmpA family protein [Campylobacterales bacterium]|nr:OmpA family protein [Campylobacterales bacterium]